MTYAVEFQQLLQTHFDSDDIPCDEFTAIRDAYMAEQSLTASAVRTSIASVIDEEESGPLPEALISSVVAWLTGRVPVKKSAVKKVPVDKVSKTVPKTVKKAGLAGATQAVIPAVVLPAVIPAVVLPAVIPAVTPAAVVSPAEALVVNPSTAPVNLEVPPVIPVVQKAMNHVARFSQMVSYTCNPGVYATAMEPLMNTPVALLDGFKRDSPLYAMLETTDLLSRIGTTVPFKQLTAEIKSKIPKPAVVTIAAIVRWFLSTEAREGLTAAFVALALPIPVKVRSAKPSKRRAKSPAAGDAPPSTLGDGSAPAPGASATVKRVKRVKRDPSERRPAKGYSLFTQRIGGVMKGAEGDYGTNLVTISDNFSEATRSKPVGGYQKFTSLLASGTLKAGESYTLANLCGVTREEKSPVVSVSGLIWGMCDATTRLRLGGESLPPSPPS